MRRAPRAGRARCDRARARSGRGAPRGAAPVRRHRADERDPSRRSQRALDREPGQGRALRPGRRCGASRSSPPSRSACSRSASAPTPRCSAWSTACCFKPMPFPESRAHRAHLGDADADHRQLDDDAQLPRAEASEPVVRGAVGGVAVDGHGAGQRRADHGSTAATSPADHFAVFGVQPIIGRTFRPEEDRARRRRVVILSHAAWQQLFRRRSRHPRSRPAARQRAASRDRRAAAGAFDRHRARPLEEPASFWRLNAFTEEELAASSHWLNPIGRLKPGVTLAQAQADVLAVRARIADTDSGVEARLERRRSSRSIELLVGDTLRQSIYVALGAVVLVLLIACANITNLLLAQERRARQGDGACASALGATPRAHRRAAAGREPGARRARRRRRASVWRRC